MRARLPRGFSLLELMIVVAVIGILVMTGIPSFRTWTQNVQIRTAAEGLIAGLQVAKTEAIRRNTAVQLKIENGSSWKVNLASDPDRIPPLQERSHDEGSYNAQLQFLPDAANTVTFNGLGRIAANADGSPPVGSIIVDNPLILNLADRRTLQIMVPPGGAIRMCDPKVGAGDPRSCV
jgi:type IV fimbrial biogenesis protein FimT